MAAIASSTHRHHRAIRLSPDSIRRMTFEKTTLGRRGFVEEEVQKFLGRTADELAAADAEKADLRAEIQRLRSYYHDRGINPDQRISSDKPSIEAVNAFSLAQQAADQHLAQAESQARGLLNTARQQHESIVEEAHLQANEAATQARNSLQGKEDSAANRDEQAALESRVAYLRTFADVTQVQVQSILEALRTELDRLATLEVSRPA